MQLLRFLHTSRVMMAAAVEKSALAKLRKSTGYSFSKCKEALQKHENDLKQAEQWLKAEAQANGWEKATKLQGRSTAQGLISILSSPSNTIILEVNCETDFVARNKKFQSLVQKITQGCYQFSNEQNNGGSLTKLPLTGEEIANLPIDGQRPVKDEIALGIGDLGENIKTRRGVCLKSTGPVLLAGYTHPTAECIPGPDTVQYGKYGAVVAFRQTGKEAVSETAKKTLTLVGRQLCQHIVGMNPKEIGSIDDPPPKKAPAPVEELQAPATTDLNEAEGTESEPDFSVSSGPELDELVLVNQDFLLDADITVREFLIQNSVEVVDFVRFECGEVIEPTYCE